MQTLTTEKVAVSIHRLTLCVGAIQSPSNPNPLISNIK